MDGSLSGIMSKTMFLIIKFTINIITPPAVSDLVREQGYIIFSVESFLKVHHIVGYIFPTILKIHKLQLC